MENEIKTVGKEGYYSFMDLLSKYNTEDKNLHVIANCRELCNRLGLIEVYEVIIKVFNDECDANCKIEDKLYNIERNRRIAEDDYAIAKVIINERGHYMLECAISEGMKKELAEYGADDDCYLDADVGDLRQLYSELYDAVNTGWLQNYTKVYLPDGSLFGYSDGCHFIAYDEEIMLYFEEEHQEEEY